MNNEFNRELWMKAQEIARQKYNEEWGTGAWEMQTDKYEREDWVFTEYEKLVKLDGLHKELEEVRSQTNKLTTGQYFDKTIAIHKQIHALEKENKDMVQRDSKGRFVSTKANSNNKTTNTTNNKKESDTMMNKTNAEKRMETLRNNGVNVDNFFNLNLQIPFGAEVKIMVEGKEMVIPATNGKVTNVENGLVDTYVGVPTILSSNGDICNAETGEVLVMANDSIAQSIMNDGYVKNSSLFRRYIFAHTMKMLEYVDRRNSRRKGWEACMKDCYAYSYQFEMLADELHTLAKLQKEDPEYFAERTRFFNGSVTVALLEDYLYRLKKYCKKQMRENPKKYRGEQYVKLARYGNVLVKDLNNKVYIPICNGIADVRGAVSGNNYSLIEKTFRDFMNKLYNKLPYDTPKCATWKDAFKGAGAYYSLQNAIRFHNVVFKNCINKYDSELKLKELLNGEYRNNVWKFHNLLVETLEYNKFDLRQSIANGHKAPNTVSERANVYRR